MSDSYLPDNEPRYILLSLEELAAKKLPHAPTFRKAADEITRLHSENKKLREALNFAVQALEYYQNPYDMAQAVPDFYSELGFGDEAEDTLDEINKLLNS